MTELEKAIKILEGIAGAWNGKDEMFVYKGDRYNEEQAHLAQEALDLLT